MPVLYQQPRNLAQLKAWWRAPSGYRDVLAIAGPLVLSTASMTVQQFIDRVFLAWYSPDALAASLPASLLSFTVLCFFLGTVSYANTFVAQYHGAGQPDKVARSVWQAVLFSLFAGVAVLGFVPLAGPIFRFAGHAPEVQQQESAYFRILVAGGGIAILSSALSTFFTGLGRTRTVMWANLGATLVNVVLDYALIFGNFGFRARGIEGAAIATVAASAFGMLVLLVIFLGREHRRTYNTLGSFGFDREIFGRLMRYGAPSGVQFTLDLVAFTLFVLFVGRIGVVELAATNLAFQVNTLAFLPMIGFSVATSTLVGQRLGEDRPQLAVRATWAALHLTGSYMGLMAILYVVIPDLFLAPFQAGADPAAFREMRETAVVILRFVALYSLFDALNLILASALKGAGDTLFVMLLSTSLGVSLMVIPTWLVCRPGSANLYLAWGFLTLYVVVVALCFLARFRHGAWREMRVIGRTQEPDAPGAHPAAAGG